MASRGGIGYALAAVPVLLSSGFLFALETLRIPRPRTERTEMTRASHSVIDRGKLVSRVRPD